MLTAGALGGGGGAAGAQSLPPGLPAMRAHGVPELAATLRDELTLSQAAARAVQAQARYTQAPSDLVRAPCTGAAGAHPHD